MKFDESLPTGFREENVLILRDFIHVYNPKARAKTLWGGGGGDFFL